MHNIKATDVLLTVDDNASTTHVTTTSDHNNVAGIELDEVGNLAGLEVELNGVVHLDVGVGVADGAAVVGEYIGNTTCADSDLADFEQLVRCLLCSNAVDREAALDIVEETEVLARLLDRDDILQKRLSVSPHTRRIECAVTHP